LVLSQTVVSVHHHNAAGQQQFPSPGSPNLKQGQLPIAIMGRRFRSKMPDVPLLPVSPYQGTYRFLAANKTFILLNSMRQATLFPARLKTDDWQLLHQLQSIGNLFFIAAG
jgi:hypothetical protein